MNKHNRQTAGSSSRTSAARKPSAARRTALQLEQLDRRLLLTSDLTPVPVVRGFRVAAGYNVVLRLDGDFARLQVSSPSAGTITVQALDTAGNPIPDQPPTDLSIRGSLTIHAKGSGNQLHLVDANIPRSLVVRASGHGHSLETNATRIGDDLLYFGADGNDQVRLGPETYIHDVTRIEGRRGNDRVEIDGAHLRRQVNINLGRDDDFLSFSNSTAERNVSVLGEHGNDTILHDNFNVGHSLQIHGHAGNDVVSAVDTVIGKNLFVHLHQGDDLFSADNSRIGDDFDLYLGSGDDGVRLRNSLVADAAIIHGQGGTDTAFLANTSAERLRTRSLEAEPTQRDKLVTFFEALNTKDVPRFETVVWEGYIQHNPFIPTGRDAIVGFFPFLQNAGTTVQNVRVIEDGNFVVVHNFWSNATPIGAEEVVTFDVFRFDDNGLVAEHWDALMANKPPNPSGRTLTDGPTAITDLDKTAANRTLAATIIETIISGTPEQIGAVVTNNFLPDYKQHSPNVGDGVAAIFAAFAVEGWDYDVLHKVIAEGNFALTISEGKVHGVHSVFYDLFRFENGKVAEHWDVIQAIPTTGLANNNGMLGGF